MWMTQQCAAQRALIFGTEFECMIPKQLNYTYAVLEQEFDTKMQTENRRQCSLATSTEGNTHVTADGQVAAPLEHIRKMDTWQKSRSSHMNGFRDYLLRHKVPLCTLFDDQFWIAPSHLADATFLDGNWQRVFRGRDLRFNDRQQWFDKMDAEFQKELPFRYWQRMMGPSSFVRTNHEQDSEVVSGGAQPQEAVVTSPVGSTNTRVQILHSLHPLRHKIGAEWRPYYGGRSATGHEFLFDVNRTRVEPAEEEHELKATIEESYGPGGSAMAMAKCEPFLFPTNLWMQKYSKVVKQASARKSADSHDNPVGGVSIFTNSDNEGTNLHARSDITITNTITTENKNAEQCGARNVKAGLGTISALLTKDPAAAMYDKMHPLGFIDREQYFTWKLYSRSVPFVLVGFPLILLRFLTREVNLDPSLDVTVLGWSSRTRGVADLDLDQGQAAGLYGPGLRSRIKRLLRARERARGEANNDSRVFSGVPPEEKSQEANKGKAEGAAVDFLGEAARLAANTTSGNSTSPTAAARQESFYLCPPSDRDEKIHPRCQALLSEKKVLMASALNYRPAQLRAAQNPAGGLQAEGSVL
ncbi:unnamed protein product [Amoebophrya sp. A120]|nr:unnamed protein product [Amoebophrya sp. A120]|eukprot:GSA120T00001794001.1